MTLGPVDAKKLTAEVAARNGRWSVNDDSGDGACHDEETPPVALDH
jgi:hypothetical protein